MNYIIDANVGDVFRWGEHFGAFRAHCRITRINDLDVHFIYLDGPQQGAAGYTTLPQNIDLVPHPLEKLAEESP